MNKPHREICSLCYEISRVGFWVPNDVWRAAIHKHYQNSIICLQCFTRLADEKSVEWDKEIKFYPVSWITHSPFITTISNSCLPCSAINGDCCGVLYWADGGKSLCNECGREFDVKEITLPPEKEKPE